MQRMQVIPAVLLMLGCAVSRADTVEARCDIYPRGSDRVETMTACRFAQRQGAVTIYRSDGITYDLYPTGEAPGNYADQDGRPAYRNRGLATRGLIFRLAEVSVYVYWDTSALTPEDGPDNPTAPFTTADYDATTLLRCRTADARDYDVCPAGILRMENQQASVVVRSPAAEIFTINFLSDYVNATNREVTAVQDGDTWTVTLANGEVYLVPLAAITGD